MALPLAAIIAAGAVVTDSIIGGISNNATNNNNLKINQMNNEFNERMMQKQMDYNTMMWEKNNAYNTPQQQMQRYRDAGINPYMAMGNIQAGNAQSAGSTSAASAAPAAPQQAWKPNFGGVAGAVLAAEQSNLVGLQAEQQVIDNQTRAIKNMEEVANLISRTQDTKMKTKLSITQYGYADQLHQLQIQNQIASTEKIIRETMLLDKNLAIFDEMSQLEISERASKIALNNALKGKTKQETVHEVQKMIETVARTKGVKISNDVAKRTAQSLVDKAKNEAVPHYNITQLPAVGAHAIGKGVKWIKDKLFD